MGILNDMRKQKGLSRFILIAITSFSVLVGCSDDKKEPDVVGISESAAAPVQVERPITSSSETSNLLIDQSLNVIRAENENHTLITSLSVTNKTSSQTPNHTLTSQAISITIDQDTE